MTAMIIDYGMCNLNSVGRAFEECGDDVFISDRPADLAKATHLVLPGVGAFGDAMRMLHERGWVDAIREHVGQKPLLGICLGMQLLADQGEESGTHAGLGLIPGRVTRLEKTAPDLRIPHVGWNEIHAVKQNALFDHIPDGTDFYFVHSYHFLPTDQNDALTTTPYGAAIVSAIAKDTLFGVQFHPEKSGRAGFQLIKNFLAA